ncbi:hypothetical protein BSLG_001067 [Batrachochytrium salamandrivorans]|nr:hypothetical protein BSLG_001067 [Batrachochytrium salamandrivorans]
MATATVKVAVRVRPMAAKELLANSSECVGYIPGTTQLVVGSTGAAGHSSSSSAAGPDSAYWMAQKSFTFDYVFDPLTTQDALYDDCVAPLVDRFLEGFNATVLAYGQTGSGKPIQWESAWIPQLQRQQPPVWELYQERSSLSLTESKKCRSRTVARQRHSVLQRGTFSRTTASTDMNATSSRSHAIFTVTLRQERMSGVGSSSGTVRRIESREGVLETGEIQPRISSASTAASASQIIVSKFHFVDLAGSERLKRTNAEGDRKKEGISINQGLLALGNVISALGDETRRSSHVPYRDSKLTRMLQDSLGGNSQTLMLACISPSDLNYAETTNTLHYANRARNIKNRVSINQEWSGAGGSGSSAGSIEKDRQIKLLQQTVSQLRTELAMIRATGGMGSSSSQSGAAAKEARYYQRRERDLVAELDMYKTTQRTTRFNMDKLQFRCHRLHARVYELVQEHAQAVIERDAAVLERSRLLVPGMCFQVKDDSSMAGNTAAMAAEAQSVLDLFPGARSKSLPDTDRGMKGLSAKDHVDEIDAQGNVAAHSYGIKDGFYPTASANESQRLDVHPVVQGYVSTISALQIRLAEAEDKIAWHTEAMSKLGRKGARFAEPVMAWTEAENKNIGIATVPTLRVLDDLRANPILADTMHEKTLVKGLRDNRMVQSMLYSDEDAQASVTGKRLEEGKNATFGFPDTSWGSSLSNESTLSTLESDTGDSGADEPPTADPDMFLIINKIQNDIADHEALVERIHRRDAEYDVMKKAYEQKLNVLSGQLSQFQREKDQALRRMHNSTGGSKKDRAGKIAAATSKYDEEKRRLDVQIAEYRQKLGDHSRQQSSSRSRADQLTKELRTTIEALKNEKARMLQDLRKEAQKHRDTSTANQREIARLRRKERTAADAAKRLQRSNQLQRVVLKKRSEEMSKSQSKLRSVMQLLKRSSTPHRISKSLAHIGSGACSPTGKRPLMSGSRPSTAVTSGRSTANGGGGGGGSRRGVSVPTVDQYIANADSLVRANARSIASDMATIETRTEFKKQMVDKELAACVLSRRSHAALYELKHHRMKLVGEQHELIAERERVVQAEFKRTGIHDAETPQYMDERLQAIDVEVGSIDIKMSSLEDLVRQTQTVVAYQSSAFSPEAANQDEAEMDLSWENALNLIRSLDHMELESAVALFLEDIIGYRVAAEEAQVRIEERENAIAELGRMVESLRAAATHAQSQLFQTRRSDTDAAHEPLSSAETRTVNDTDLPIEVEGVNHEEEEEEKEEEEVDAMDEVNEEDPEPLGSALMTVGASESDAAVRPVKTRRSLRGSISSDSISRQSGTSRALQPTRAVVGSEMASVLASVLAADGLSKRERAASPDMMIRRQNVSMDCSSSGSAASNVSNISNALNALNASNVVSNALSNALSNVVSQTQPSTTTTKEMLLRRQHSADQLETRMVGRLTGQLTTSSSNNSSNNNISVFPASLKHRLSMSPVRQPSVWRSASTTNSSSSSSSGGGGSYTSNSFYSPSSQASNDTPQYKNDGAASSGSTITPCLSSSTSSINTGTMGGLDVFERLANAHTRASQAKVIQRVVSDKESPSVVAMDGSNRLSLSTDSTIMNTLSSTNTNAE